MLSNQHRLLGKDARHRALPCCRGDRGDSGVGKVTGSVDARHTGFAALVGPEGDAGWRINRGEAQCVMQACGWPGTRMREQDIDCNIGAGIDLDSGTMALVTGDFGDQAINERYLAVRQIGPYVGGDVVIIAEDSQPVGPIVK